MRVALLSVGRFWLLDLARELTALGHQARLYSLVPPWRTSAHGLPRRCNRWLAPLMPLYALQQAALGTPAESASRRALVTAVDAYAARRIEPCDVLVAMSGIAVRSLDEVRRKHGAVIFLERASRHILSQRRILESMPGRTRQALPPIPHWMVARELAGYELADRVTVPSQQVEQSFLDRGHGAGRLFRNPFGASTKAFRPTAAPATDPPTIIMTGTWSLRKGCDVLVEAWRRLNDGTRLIHVGPVGDAPLPADPAFEHVDPVPQPELARYYARAHVFALASREEGLALVQVQALCCGLRLVCTDRTGGADLRRWVDDPAAIRVVPPDAPAALAGALRAALTDLPAPGVRRDSLGERRAELSWRAYAQRYERCMLDQLASRKGPAP